MGYELLWWGEFSAIFTERVNLEIMSYIPEFRNYPGHRLSRLYFRDFPKGLREISRIVTRIGQDRFLQYHLQFVSDFESVVK
jgi:hypothetical protein